MRLIDAPVGLFMSSRELCVKTEYFTNSGVDAYIVSSGERFWGGAKTAKELNNVEVTPIDPESLRPKAHWVRKETSSTRWFECSNCGEEPLVRNEHSCFTLFCPFCGADMRGEINEKSEM